MRGLFIIGAESTAKEIKSAVNPNFYDLIYFVDKNLSNNTDTISEDLIQTFLVDHNDLIYSMTNLKLRRQISKIISEHSLNLVNVVSDFSHVALDVSMQSGNYLAAGTIVSNEVKIGSGCIFNFNSVLGHNSIIGDNVIVSPGAIIGGNVIIGNNCFIGANSFIKQGVCVGENVSIDAMTYIHHDVEPNQLCTNRGFSMFNKIKNKDDENHSS